MKHEYSTKNVPIDDNLKQCIKKRQHKPGRWMEHQLRLPCLCPEIAQAHTSITTLAAFSLYVCVSRLLREYVPVSSSKMAIGSKIELGRVISILFVFFVKLFFNFS